MRQAFATVLEEFAVQDERVVAITGDLGFMVLDGFAKRFPNRFFNAGVAEQDMMGIATGLAEAGLIPFVYSIATFAVLRPYEFIRNGPVLHRLPVRIVGVGGGFEYGLNGVSHYGLEDVAVLRALPGMTIVAPADYQQARTALLATRHCPGPVYYRLGKNDQATVPGLDGIFALGRLQIIKTGGDVALIAMGAIAGEVVAAADLLESQGVSSTVAIVASVSPAPVDDLVSLLPLCRLALAIESHSAVGGVGSLVAEIVADHGLPCRVIRCGVTVFPETIGNTPYLQEQLGLSAAALAARALEAYRGLT